MVLSGDGTSPGVMREGDGEAAGEDGETDCVWRPLLCAPLKKRAARCTMCENGDRALTESSGALPKGASGKCAALVAVVCACGVAMRGTLLASPRGVRSEVVASVQCLTGVELSCHKKTQRLSLLSAAFKINVPISISALVACGMDQLRW